MGTELIARGLRVPESCPEAWNLDRPEEVRAVHAAYAEAGAEVVQTNTFGALRPRLLRYGLAHEVARLITAAVELARTAAPGCAVVGSLGPSGDPESDSLAAAYRESAAAFARAGVDALHLETQYDPRELELAATAIREAAPGLPLITSIAALRGNTGLETVTGVPIDRMVRAMKRFEPDALGANCSLDAERMGAVVAHLRQTFEDSTIWARPQAKQSPKCAGQAHNQDPLNQTRSSEPLESFVKLAAALFEKGATAVGGCCGIGPRHVAALRKAVGGEM